MQSMCANFKNIQFLYNIRPTYEFSRTYRNIRHGRAPLMRAIESGVSEGKPLVRERCTLEAPASNSTIYPSRSLSLRTFAMDIKQKRLPCQGRDHSQIKGEDNRMNRLICLKGGTSSARLLLLSSYLLGGELVLQTRLHVHLFPISG